MTTKELTTLNLKNGLVLQCIDQSRQIAVDRWYICVSVEVAIPVEKKWFDSHPLDEGMFKRIKSALGEEVVFRQKKERNFVSEGQKEEVLKSICDGAVEMGKSYLGSQNFASKFILKEFDKRRQPK